MQVRRTLARIWSIYLFIERIFRRFYHWIERLLGDDRPKNSIAVLDGVRAVAILTVAFYHISLMTRGTLWSPNEQSHYIMSSVALSGGAGVTLFFVLSGFLLFMPYAKAFLFDKSWPKTWQFYMRRVLRIVPAYYIALFLIIILSQQQYLQPAHWLDVSLFLTFFMDSTSLTYMKLNGPFWTLAVEWQFYLLLPLMMLAIAYVVRRGTVRQRIWKLTFCLLGIIGWGMFSRFWGMYFMGHPTKTFLVPRSVLDVALFLFYGMSGKYLETFAVGMLACLCYTYAQQVGPDHHFTVALRRLSMWLWRAGIVVLFIMALWHFDQFYPGHWKLIDPISVYYNGWFNYFDLFSNLFVAIGYGLCILAILYAPSAFQSLFAWKPLRWIGLISFSMYMLHLPLLNVFHDYVLPHLTGLNSYALYPLFWIWFAVVIVPVSFLMFILIEKPFMKLGDRFRPGKATPQARVEELPGGDASGAPEAVLVKR